MDRFSFRQRTFLWLGRTDLFRRVYDEFTHGLFQLNYKKYGEPGYFTTDPVVKTLPVELLSRLGFLAQIYLTGFPEWLLVDRDIRRDLKHCFFPSKPFRVRQEYRRKKRLIMLQAKAPKAPWWVYEQHDTPRQDFLFTWNRAMRPHLWKEIKPYLARGDVHHSCGCGFRSVTKICYRCQARFLTEELKKAKRMWKNLLRLRRGYLRGSLLPYFYTADPDYLPEVEEHRKYYYSPLNLDVTDQRVTLLREMQKASHTWINDIEHLKHDELLRWPLRQQVKYTDVGPNPTAIPVRMYTHLVGRCIKCDTELEKRDLDDPEWYDGNVTCPSCTTGDEICTICGRPDSYLGICLPCISKKVQGIKLGSAFKESVASTCAGSYRIKAQHYNLRAEFQHGLCEVQAKERVPCKRCGSPARYRNGGYCYSCRSIVQREQEARLKDWLGSPVT